MSKKTTVEAPTANPSLLEVTLSGLNASVEAINKVIAEGKKDEGAKAKVRSNVLHLTYGIGTELIKDSKTDTKAFTDAIELGKAFLS